FALQALDRLKVGDEIIMLTWLHQARRETLKVYPRGNKCNPLTGVFATRSPDRPNPIGLHRVTIREIDKNRLLVGPIEAIDGTPVVDIKCVLAKVPDW
ncbi:MAG TPA: tRNA (N6-threonylcarbamoyladenosine(37)-N6)-methyltransferase TrmO, partial [Terriglobales bacterium]|nr:tRNA (N6-threonylcarbamoyladenosine(37)-N6)-methyltransferase TrmO [Terriglobales bacterium]